MSGQALLQVQQVSAAYGTYRALFDVSFEVAPGSVVALVGANGAGKSTVTRVVSGLLPPTSGRIRFAGRDVTGRPPHAIARDGLCLVPEGRAVFGTLSVEENLTVALRQRVGGRRLAAAVRRAFEAVPSLADRRRQQVGTLSGGQQRLLSLAAALAEPPRLLVVDELSLGLAPQAVDDVYHGLAAIRDQGTALLVVEQQVDRALALAEQAVVLTRGSVGWAGPAGEAPAALERMLAGRFPRPAG